MKNSVTTTKSIFCSLIFSFFTCSFSLAQSSTPVLLKDTNEEVREYDPTSFVALNNEVFFWGFKAETGRELYKLTGSTISLVKEFVEGPSSYYGAGSDYNSSTSIYKQSGSLYFLAGNPRTGVKLYKSGGDASTTVELGTIATGSSFQPGSFGGFGSVILFRISIDAVNELWAYNPSVQSTPFKLSDISTGTFTNFNSKVYFTGCTDSACSFMASDGTVAGTGVVKSGIESYTSEPFAVVGSNLFFRAYQVGTGAELWVSDGTSGGTHIVSDLVSGAGSSYPTKISEVGSGVVFFAGDGVHSSSNPQDEEDEAGELFYSDGSSISFVKDFNLSSMDGGISFNSEIAVRAGYVYFVAKSSVSASRSLWITDGTSLNTVELKEGISPRNMISTGSQVLFFLPASGSLSFYKSDGTPSGTVNVETFTYPSSEVPDGYFLSTTPVNSQILFAVSGSSPKSKYPVTTLYASNLSTNSVVKTLESSGTRSSNTSFDSVKLGDILVFKSHTLGLRDGGLDFTESLYSTKGSSDTTTLLTTASIVDGSSTAFGSLMVVSNSKAVFSQADNLFATDGTSGGTAVIRSETSIAFGDVDKRAVVGDYLYFIGNTASTGTELWKTNGTEAGTSIVKDITSGASSTSMSNFLSFNGKLLFVAGTIANGDELWISDGTESGTSMVKDIKSGGVSSSPRFLTELNGAVYFVASEDSNKSSLWKTDGTEGGTTLVKNISSSSNYDILSVKKFGNKLIILASDGGSSGYEPWISDGTESGTLLLSDINASGDSVESFNNDNFISINGKFYFVANNGSSGNELYVTDGTGSGTRLVSDLVSGSSSSNPDYFVALDSTKFVFVAGSSSQKRMWSIDTATDTVTKLSDTLNTESLPKLFQAKAYFNATSDSYGSELWMTDGTVSGTSLVLDVLSGSEGSGASPFAATSHQLYFTANDSAHSIEPWVINLDGCLDDSTKTAPGTCGCDVSDVDSDSDGNLDCEDLCPSDVLKILPGACGCGKAELDSNKDKIVDCGSPGAVSPGQKLENAPTATPSKKSITVTAQKFSGIRIKGKKKSGKVSYTFELSAKIKGQKVVITRTSTSNKLKITGLSKGTYKVRYKISIRDEKGRLQKPTSWSPSVSVRIS